ncbi:hypothetical protein CCR85_01355 [Rhodothalassium salexigens]|uniref:head completion/stabilization protein n=1 Tax=Rhodothalassium salexigens TaxID=1086 RepID=UPI001911E3F0|nr:head completion/stabilization protein [Rhodothalassium salexigens]MBK5910139.1 hypothetical protein [Rhodothalassium salexigens]MBK5920761.1 hypothetical protein [Rhodothalassium salexigens]
MASSFIPSAPQAPLDRTLANEGFWPALSLAEMRDRTGLSMAVGAERIEAALTAAMIEVNAALARWRADQSAATLDRVPAPLHDGVSAKVLAYKAAVYTRARAALIETERDYDSTKSGHDRADALETTADSWLRLSHEALARVMDRARVTVELI